MRFQGDSSPNQYDHSLGWTDGRSYYELLKELELDMTEAVKQHNYDHMMIIYEEILIKITPYIYKHMDDDDKKNLSDFDELRKLKQNFTVENTQYESQKNAGISSDIIRIINKKRLRISELMAVAGLGIPLKKITPLSEKIFETR